MSSHHRESDETTYPPEPWDLHGHAHIGVWLVRKGDLPAPHSPATRPITIFGRGVVTAAFFVYERPSPLTYHEIMATVLVREGWRPRVSITHIWVDSAASRAGGRALWAIPKELAGFEVTRDVSYVAADIGSLELGRFRRLPGRWPLRFGVAQDREGSLLVSPVRGTARFAVASGRWSFSPDGPLGFLASGRPLLTICAHPFQLLFGRR